MISTTVLYFCGRAGGLHSEGGQVVCTFLWVVSTCISSPHFCGWSPHAVAANLPPIKFLMSAIRHRRPKLYVETCGDLNLVLSNSHSFVMWRPPIVKTYRYRTAVKGSEFPSNHLGWALESPYFVHFPTPNLRTAIAF
jgi:hypothetical protein